jgi:predicted RNase H-like HicB family nuclease
MTDYIALIRKVEGSDYSVDFPDFEGCITAGSTLDEARDMASEALGLHIAGMIEDGDEIPEPSSLESVMQDDHNRDAVVVLVSPRQEPDTPIRINVSIRRSELERIDKAADARGQKRSAFLAAAALAYAGDE